MKAFEKYLMYVKKNGKIVSVNRDAFELANEAFELFKSMYNTQYGSIEEDDNLISIHTGGWSNNEELIREFQDTAWWVKYHRITASGGHYYFNTDIYAGKDWAVITKNFEVVEFN